jgi:Carboxypeptidase regulatory-like domain
VPVASTLRAVAWTGADTTGDVHVAVPQAGHAVQDFSIGVPAARVGATRDSGMLPGAVLLTEAPRLRAIVRGTVRTPDGLPLADAAVRVIGRGSAVRSAADGSFVIADAGSGTATIEARRIGYSPHRVPLVLRQAEPANVSLILPVERVQLDTVRVVAGRAVPTLVRGIERRWRTGQGAFLTADLIMERSVRFTTDALRGINGVFVISGKGTGNGLMMRGTFGSHCSPTVYIDGALVAGGSNELDTFVSRDQAAAIEVYARPNLVPAEFYNLSNGCGVVAVWSKFATEHLRVLPTKSDRERK